MLDGKRIMIVEDEALLALDLTMVLEDVGACVAGPYHRLDRALNSDRSDVDAAILDVDLAGLSVFPLADELKQAGVPIVFHTGRADLDELRRRYGDTPIIVKPAIPEEVTESLSRLIANLDTPPNDRAAAE